MGRREKRSHLLSRSGDLPLFVEFCSLGSRLMLGLHSASIGEVAVELPAGHHSRVPHSLSCARGRDASMDVDRQQVLEQYRAKVREHREIEAR
jgi:hypothetical protein